MTIFSSLTATSLALTLVPILVAFIVYIVKLERRLTKISTDICWIKKALDVKE